MTTATMVGLTPDLYGYAHCAVCGELRKELVDGRCTVPCEGRVQSALMLAEREECARVVEWLMARTYGQSAEVERVYRDVAAAIRARGA
jgi:hypothetical protein